MHTQQELIVLEGIASSGKTTLALALSTYFVKHGFSVSIFDETETLMPLIKNESVNVSLEFLENYSRMLTNQHAEVLLVDRFHFTHAFRTQSDMHTFVTIERFLDRAFHTTVVLLSLNPEKIKKRIAYVENTRGKSWKYRKEGSPETVYQYYLDQQTYLRDLANDSLLDVLEVNSSDLTVNQSVTKIVRSLH
ncbi:MAG: hypothetical protein COU08_04605 [Candidatus Harrisonbacteria bacterium CG10_big_fil_rev_8_21_14_0_10_42_17]|uniref:Thymidylate kinase-like domain-containing protein n=1 Tax=Candidatus Harrisonbacteria bacterium CG10_big_fil_rev_8_21_14_0_10_42_17 TaxID=1974584 RepID=A0A2M6WH36_9BACT|nr:MAG: hypothetical protein COU08_04605 [Candidatus Harrisonbacteria bacterium CG10_big_fil_rev_8_21_14_0_10_42_17]